MFLIDGNLIQPKEDGEDCRWNYNLRQRNHFLPDKIFFQTIWKKYQLHFTVNQRTDCYALFLEVSFHKSTYWSVCYQWTDGETYSVKCFEWSTGQRRVLHNFRPTLPYTLHSPSPIAHSHLHRLLPPFLTLALWAGTLLLTDGVLQAADDAVLVPKSLTVGGPQSLHLPAVLDTVSLQLDPVLVGLLLQLLEVGVLLQKAQQVGHDCHQGRVWQLRRTDRNTHRHSGCVMLIKTDAAACFFSSCLPFLLFPAEPVRLFSSQSPV